MRMLQNKYAEWLSARHNGARPVVIRPGNNGSVGQPFFVRLNTYINILKHLDER